MESKDNKKEDLHGNKEMTLWVHRHRRLAKWLVRAMGLGVASLSYYLKKQETKIGQEEKEKMKD